MPLIPVAPVLSARLRSPGGLRWREPGAGRQGAADVRPLALRDRLIREGDAPTPDNPYDVHTLKSSHCGWLVAPAPAARVPAGTGAPAVGTA